MTTDNFCFYLQNRLIQTSQTGGQWHSDTSPFSIPWFFQNIFINANVQSQRNFANVKAALEKDNNKM
jgi:hypothetical protein